MALVGWEETRGVETVIRLSSRSGGRTLGLGSAGLRSTYCRLFVKGGSGIYLAMENYVPSAEEEVALQPENPFPEAFHTEGTIIIEVKQSTRIQQTVEYALKHLTKTLSRFLIFHGVGESAEKCITCVEILKKRYKGTLHQWNSLTFQRKLSYWDPLIDGMDRLRVTVDLPALFILVSLDEFPAEFQCLSIQSSKETCSVFEGEQNIEVKTGKTGKKSGQSNKASKPKKNNPSNHSEAPDRPRRQSDVHRD
ncbi:unnamed protein product, partial [Mesorhabditis spiculigera]